MDLKSYRIKFLYYKCLKNFIFYKPILFLIVERKKCRNYVAKIVMNNITIVPGNLFFQIAAKSAQAFALNVMFNIKKMMHVKKFVPNAWEVSQAKKM